MKFFRGLRTIGKTSIGVTIPPDIVVFLGIKPMDKIVIEEHENESKEKHITIRKIEHPVNNDEDFVL